MADSDSDISIDSDEEDMNNGHLPQLAHGFLFHLGAVSGRFNTNDTLVDHLKEIATLPKPVEEAMRAVHRDEYVPGGFAENNSILHDSPYPIREHGFNMSAPHIHATCLVNLDLKPGHKVLDIGSGSGVLSAYMAYMAGPEGKVVGFDLKDSINAFAAGNIMRQEQSNPLYSDKAAKCEFKTLNAFLPKAEYQGFFDRIVVGASCLESKIEGLLSMLKPEGGILVTPVIPSELRKYIKDPTSCSSKFISSVRFSDLVVPRDLDVLKYQMEEQRMDALKVPVPVSNFASDARSISGSLGTPSPRASSSLKSELSAEARLMPVTPKVSRSGSLSDNASPFKGLKRMRAQIAKFVGSPRSSMDVDEAMEDIGEEEVAPHFDFASLGKHDCSFAGHGWVLPAHKSVVRARCELLRAQSESGMRDADSDTVHVPEVFTKIAMEAFLNYCYTDELACTDFEACIDCLQAATYFCTPHLVQLCELNLSGHLRPDNAEATKHAARLLAVADENQLQHLEKVTLDYILYNYADVASTEGYAYLNKEQMDLIAQHACKQFHQFNQKLDAMIKK